MDPMTTKELRRLYRRETVEPDLAADTRRRRRRVAAVSDEDPDIRSIMWRFSDAIVEASAEASRELRELGLDPRTYLHRFLRG